MKFTVRVHPSYLAVTSPADNTIYVVCTLKLLIRKLSPIILYKYVFIWLTTSWTKLYPSFSSGPKFLIMIIRKIIRTHFVFVSFFVFVSLPSFIFSSAFIMLADSPPPSPPPTPDDEWPQEPFLWSLPPYNLVCVTYPGPPRKIILISISTHDYTQQS